MGQGARWAGWSGGHKVTVVRWSEGQVVQMVQGDQVVRAVRVATLDYMLSEKIYGFHVPSHQIIEKS